MKQGTFNLIESNNVEADKPADTTAEQLNFVDLFAGLGGFHTGLSRLGHTCVFASELDSDLRDKYAVNYPDMAGRIYGDINHHIDDVPPHDILCAGFPCQPFSKSGFQKGLEDPSRGTLFHTIVKILSIHHPRYVFLENVGNFERHDDGRTWAIVQEELAKLGYDVRGTSHVTKGGKGLLSPHHLGFPHHRERFFMVAQKSPFSVLDSPFPRGVRGKRTNIDALIDANGDLTDTELELTKLTSSQRNCIEHWNKLLSKLPTDGEFEYLPSFPLWADEAEATYPFDESTPHSCSTEILDGFRKSLGFDAVATREDIFAHLPQYALRKDERFPEWKIRFIKQNRDWFKKVRTAVDTRWWNRWYAKLRKMPASFRKLEWNVKGEQRDLWEHILQLRPSGLRAKRYENSPALVAMTATQIPIMGPRQRFLTVREGLRLQGLPDTMQLPEGRTASFKALGNGIHAGVVEAIARTWLKN